MEVTKIQSYKPSETAKKSLPEIIAKLELLVQNKPNGEAFWKMFVNSDACIEIDTVIRWQYPDYAVEVDSKILETFKKVWPNSEY